MTLSVTIYFPAHCGHTGSPDWGDVPQGRLWVESRPRRLRPCGPVRSCGPVYGRYRFIGRVLGHLERKFLKYSFSWYDSFIGTKVLGTFAPEERKFHRSESSKERMFHGTKVPRERKFSLWSFRSRERKCTGTKRPGIHNIIIMILIIKEKIAESQLQWQLRQFYVPRPGRAAF